MSTAIEPTTPFLVATPAFGKASENLRRRYEGERARLFVLRHEREREELFRSVLRTALDPVLSEQVVRFWERIKGNVPGYLRAPYLDILDEGALLTWDHEAHHLDVEIVVGEPLEFFYRNRITGEIWEADCDPATSFPEGVLRALNVFRVVR